MNRAPLVSIRPLEHESRFAIVIDASLRGWWKSIGTTVIVLANAIQTARCAAAPFAYITNQKADNVSVIDTATDQVVTTLTVGHEPAGVAVSRDGKHIVITNPGSKDISLIDGQQQKVIARISRQGGGVLEPVSQTSVVKATPLAATIATSTLPTPANITRREPTALGTVLGVALSPDGERIYLADWYAHKISIIDWPQSNQRTIKTGTRETQSTAESIPVGHTPAGLVVSPDGARLYVANRDDNSISEIDTASHKTLRTVTVGTHPFGIHLSDDAQQLYSANVESNTITVIDTPSLQVTHTLTVGQRPYALVSAAGRLFVTNQYDNTVSVIDLQSYQIIATVRVGEYPEGIAAHPNGQRVYVANWFDNTVTVIDTHQLKALKTIPTADGSRAFGNFIAPR